MAVPLQRVAWEAPVVLPVYDAGLESYALHKQGVRSGAMAYLASLPWVARATIDLRPEFGLLMHIDGDATDLVSSIVSQENSCRFCYAAMRLLCWARGMSQARLDLLEAEISRADLPARVVAAIEFGRAQSRFGPACADAAGEALRAAGFSEEEFKEIAYTVAETDFSNRTHTFLAVPALPLEELPRRWLVRFSRPWVKKMVNAGTSRGRQAPTFERAPDCPFERIVEAYADLPIAVALRHALDEMWASTHLTRRCKLLMVAVIAHGLGGDVCAVYTSNALASEGIDPAMLALVLAHLDAPRLDDTERLLISFARETIWYEPARIQRSVRTLARDLSVPQVLEAVGVAALANGLCRLGSMVATGP